jgi:ATP-dependent helicase HepA
VVKTRFVPGQRWISDTEANLGLGIVLEVADRRVMLSFPAAAEQRTYAMDSAPISRVIYQVGDFVSNLDGLRFKVDEVIENQSCLIYRGYDEDEQLVTLPELELDSFVQFGTPQARMFAGQIDSLKRFNLRVETLGHLREHQLSTVNGLLGARVQLLPHQIYIANETGKRHAPRVLLADEVGLGKTIEAGLILHQQLVSGRARRAMVVVPDSLVHQWLVEMLRRFNLHFTILDEARCLALADTQMAPDWDDELTLLTDELSEHEENPFESAQLVLCSLSFLANSPKRLAQAKAAGWDLLLVDEAHHLQWSEQQVSDEYHCIEELARVARGLLLLTATPEQLGLESHFARLRLLDPDRYYDLQKFREEESKYQPVNALVEQLLALNEADAVIEIALEPLLESLADYIGADRINALREAVEAEASEPQHIAVDQIIRDLLDQHGTGRVLFRNTRSAVPGFPERQLNIHPLPSPDFYAELAADSTLDHLITPERVLGSDEDDGWLKQDSRVNWLADWLLEKRDEKVLLICAHASTAIALEAHLRLYRGITTAVFHEQLDLIARDRSAAYFADMEEGAQVLICSEIGSEGRNFQFANHLVLFDLPLNPDLLEQRIGRLDRIGQRHTVQIHVPYFEGSAQAVLLRWYDESLNSFRAACSAGQLISDTFKEQLALVLQQPLNITLVENLVSDTLAVRLETEQRLQQGRDRLLELNSCDQPRAAELIEQIIEQERSGELSRYMERVFDLYGVEQEHHSAQSIVLQPGDHMHTSHFPGLPEGGVTATFQREFALSREDIQFLSWEHPMVSGAMDMVLSEQFGNVALGTVKLGPIKPGTVLLEAVFVMQCAAPTVLQLFRYLPCITVRVLMDQKGTQLGKVLSHDKLNQLIKRVPKGTARELIRHAQPELVPMIKNAEESVAPQQQQLIDEAMQCMQEQQSNELQRLEALSAVNPNIRQQEIDFLREETKSLAQYLQTAQLKLDALRVVVAV